MKIKQHKDGSWGVRKGGFLSPRKWLDLDAANRAMFTKNGLDPWWLMSEFVNTHCKGTKEQAIAAMESMK